MPPDSIDAFLAHLHRHATVTQALAAWCAPRFGAAPGRITARVLQDTPLAYPGEALRFRRVQLCWGDLPVSEAENRYLPDRLPAAVRQTLLTGNTPFGAAIAALGPQRRTTALEQAPGGPHFLHITATVSIHGQDVAEVTEHYYAALLTGSQAVPLLLGGGR